VQTAADLLDTWRHFDVDGVRAAVRRLERSQADDTTIALVWILAEAMLTMENLQPGLGREFWRLTDKHAAALRRAGTG